MRQYGYYWVCYQGEWEVALFAPWRNLRGEIVGSNWSRIGELFEEYDDDQFDKIAEMRIPFPDHLGNPPTF